MNQKNLTVEQSKDFWLRLDNAAKIYPAVKDKELTSVFRISAELKDPIKIKPFFEAVHAIEERFPYYKVKLKAGFFWYYLEHYNLPIPVELDREIPCRAFDKQELMFRVLVRENKIGVEFSHILTDGTGAFEFLKILLSAYFEKCGLFPPADLQVTGPGETLLKEECEDAYKRYFKKLDTGPVKIPGAFHVPFPLKKAPRFDVLIAVMAVGAVLKKAKEYGVSLTEYLTAVYLLSLQHIYQRQSLLRKRINRKVLRIEIPVNLRRIYPSRTMRNFSLYVLPGIDLRLGLYTFDEIVKIVYHKMQLETDRKLINKMISRNVSGEKNPFLRGIPLFIKSLFLSKLYTIGTKQ
ncbi:MAG TPA: hypothetical protein VD772_01925, partial [Anseongella sp.]|nr:hypothetical protein [Anseongella sp.]